MAWNSIDGLLRPSLFEPTTKEDWNHVVNQHYMIPYIIDFDYALQKHEEIKKRSLFNAVAYARTFLR